LQITHITKETDESHLQLKTKVKLLDNLTILKFNLFTPEYFLKKSYFDFNFFQAGASTLSEIQEEYGELVEWLMQKTQYLEHHMQTKTISMDYNVRPKITQPTCSNGAFSNRTLPSSRTISTRSKLFSTG
jgi:hypothetical protein